MEKRRKQKLTTRFNPNFKKDFFTKVNTPEKAYWLGYLYNLGNFRKDGFFYIEQNSNGDTDSLIRLLEDIDLITDIMHRRRNRRDGKVISSTYYIGFYCQEFVDGFFGYFPGGDSRLDDSQSYPNIAPEFNRHFIRGLFESFSSVIQTKILDKPSYMVRIDGNYDMLRQIQVILKEEAEITCHLANRDTANRFSHALTMQGRLNLPDFILYLYNDVDSYNERKSEQLLQVYSVLYPGN